MLRINVNRFDWWLIAVIVGSVLFTFGLGISLYPQTKIGSYTCFRSGLLTIALIFLVVFPCKYTLTHDRLIIQSGILKQEALYSQMIAVRKSHNPLSAPALSLQRVEIIITNGFKHISPQNWEQFIEELTSKLSPTLEQ